MEHRCAKRKKTNVHVQYVALDEVVHVGRIIDLSDLGARIITADDIPEFGSIVEVTLPAPDRSSPAAWPHVRGFVTWVRNHAFGLIWITDDAVFQLLGNGQQHASAS
ncbi:MAG: PilZ domain-containing protein [Gammaproteobacteria bacterium]